MNYFKKMVGIRTNGDDGFSANYGKVTRSGYRTSKRYKELITRDRRAKKKWVKNRELKLFKKDEISGCCGTCWF